MPARAHRPIITIPTPSDVSPAELKTALFGERRFAFLSDMFMCGSF